jgi:RHS repeat-associated protein
MTDSRGVTTYGYDALDRLLEVVHPEGQVGYGYDQIGNRTGLTLPGGKSVTYSYDALNRLNQLQDWQGRVTGYIYDPASNLLQTLYPNGRTARYRYDAANRLTEVGHRLGSVLTAQFNYTLDPLGNRTQMVRRLALSPLPLALTSTFAYGYDALSQLVSVEDRLLGVLQRRTEYAYDPTGNRTSLKRFRRLGGQFKLLNTTLYTYDVADRLLQAGSTTYAYDSNGNRITESGPSGNPTFEYDAANRLVQVDRGWGHVDYGYDGDGNKVETTVDNGSSVKTTRFLNDVATALPVVLREDEASTDVDYVYGLGLVAEELNALGQQPAPFFYHSDGLGSTVALTDGQGKPRAGYQYDPWGNLEISLGSSPNRFLFTGEERDADTGLYYLRARWYDPAVGRLLTRDPFAGFLAGPLSMNRYVYVRNNPVRLSDPSGLSPLERTDIAPPYPATVDVTLPYPTSIEEAIKDPARRALWHDPGLPPIGRGAGVQPPIMPTLPAAPLSSDRAQDVFRVLFDLLGIAGKATCFYYGIPVCESLSPLPGVPYFVPRWAPGVPPQA